MKWLWCLPILHSKCNWWHPRHTSPSSKNKHASVHCPTRLHLIPPPHLPGRGLEVLLKDELIQQGEDLLWFFAKFSFWPTIRWISMSCFCCCCYMMHCYELLLLLLYDELLWVAAAIWWIAMSCCCYMMSCYKLLLLLLYDELLWAAPVDAIWWIARSCSCCYYMMNCYELLLLLLYDELLWAAASIWWIAHCCCCMMSCYELLLLYDAFRWCCYTIITSHLDHRISINNCSSF